MKVGQGHGHKVRNVTDDELSESLMALADQDPAWEVVLQASLERMRDEGRHELADLLSSIHSWMTTGDATWPPAEATESPVAPDHYGALDPAEGPSSTPVGTPRGG